MKMLFKQRFFSWFDSYDIYDEQGQTLYTVKGQLAWGHCLHILNANGEHIATVQEKVFSFLPKFYLFYRDEQIGTLSKEFSFFHPIYNIDYNGWCIDGSILEWDYTIKDPSGNTVAVINKELWHMTDTYIIDVMQPQNALYALMVVLAIDAEKCSRNN